LASQAKARALKGLSETVSAVGNIGVKCRFMAAILDLPELRARVHRWTVAEYEKLGDDPAFRRSELIRGIIIEKMSKSPLHSTLATRIYLFLVGILRPEFVARKEEPLRLADSMPEPDISVMRGTLADFETRHPVTAELVVDVAVSSVAPDRENASLYAEAGIAEYWIVLGESAAVEVYRRPENGVYQEKRTFGRGESIPDVAVVGGAVPVDAWFAA
jgi:Uma2 family endonuclease